MLWGKLEPESPPRPPGEREEIIGFWLGGLFLGLSSAYLKWDDEISLFGQVVAIPSHFRYTERENPKFFFYAKLNEKTVNPCFENRLERREFQKFRKRNHYR